LGEKQIVATLPEGCLPDGIAIDARETSSVPGSAWCHFAVDKTGEEVRRGEMECTDPTNLAFGGPGHRTLFVNGGRAWPRGRDRMALSRHFRRQRAQGMTPAGPCAENAPKGEANWSVELLDKTR